MEIQNKIGEQVFDKLRSKFSHITLGDEEGASTQDPLEAVFFNFNYTDNEGHDHGNITVSLIDRTMKIYYSKNISTDLKGSELTTWYAFLQDMRKTAMSNLYGFDTHDITKSNLDVADIRSTVNRNSIEEGKANDKSYKLGYKDGRNDETRDLDDLDDNGVDIEKYEKGRHDGWHNRLPGGKRRPGKVKEGKMYGSGKKSSFQDHGPAKIIVRHTESIDPEVRGSRSRKIKSVFIETFEGERFKMESNSLPGARAMAQHVGQGGRPYDDIGESITTMVNEIANLRPFISRNRNAIYEDETTMAMVESAKEYYAETRKTLGKLKGKRGYKAYAESFEVTEQYEYVDEEASAMKDRFTSKRFNDKMESAMKTVHKAYSLKNMKPQAPSMKPLAEFEQWVEETTMLEAEEMCSTECCGKPVSQCHCGPDCAHCDCYEKNKLDEAEEWSMGARDHRNQSYHPAINPKTKKPYTRAEWEDANKKPVKEDDGEKVYGMFAKGGSVGSNNDKPWKTGSREDMIAAAKRYRKQLSKGERGYYKMGYTVRPLKKGETVTEQQLDEGIFQGIFNFMWNMAGKIPSIKANRKSDSLGQEFTRFKETMTDEKIDEWLTELSNKLKSGHSSTAKAGHKRLKILRSTIKSVSNSKNELSFEQNMRQLRGALRQYEGFAKSSNDGVANRKREARARKKAGGGTVKPLARNTGNNKLAAWVAKGAKELDEGTWALPDTPEKQGRLETLMSSPLKFGVDGDNATQALYDLIGDDALFDMLAAAAQEQGPEADARQTIIDFTDSLEDWDEQSQSHFFDEAKPSKSDDAYDAMHDCPKCGHDLDQGYRGSTNVKRCRNCGFEKKGYDYQKFEEGVTNEDALLPKATPSDYLEVADKGSADAMVAALKKDGKKGTEAGAKATLKRMEEQSAKAGLHSINESMEQLKRHAGIIK